jgi:ATP-dependent DNA helicase RecG
VFVVCPEIGETPSARNGDSLNVKKALIQYAKWLPEYMVGSVHGKMTLEERETVLNKFQKNEIQILIATTVIEVGVDMPNASVIIIEGSEKFGLTQLHQLRGRVGRSHHKSHCFLFADTSLPRVSERIAAFAATNDGFQIAEQDLLLRGPGEFLGTVQSGALKLRVGHLIRDAQLLNDARQDMKSILQSDPSLSSPENAPLRSLIAPQPRKIHL